MTWFDQQNENFYDVVCNFHQYISYIEIFEIKSVDKKKMIKSVIFLKKIMGLLSKAILIIISVRNLLFN